MEGAALRRLQADPQDVGSRSSCPFRLRGPEVSGSLLFQAVGSTAEPVNSEKGTESEVLNKTRKPKPPPASAPAPRDARQVGACSAGGVRGRSACPTAAPPPRSSHGSSFTVTPQICIRCGSREQTCSYPPSSPSRGRDVRGEEGEGWRAPEVGTGLGKASPRRGLCSGYLHGCGASPGESGGVPSKGEDTLSPEAEPGGCSEVGRKPVPRGTRGSGWGAGSWSRSGCPRLSGADLEVGVKGWGLGTGPRKLTPRARPWFPERRTSQRTRRSQEGTAGRTRPPQRARSSRRTRKHMRVT